jgi:hypothetical protein
VNAPRLLVVWRLPEGDVVEALKHAIFAKGDKVICAEWLDDGPSPQPRWYGDQLRKAMPSSEYEQINRTIDRVGGHPQAKRDSGFAPFPNLTDDRMKGMTDNEGACHSRVRT